jgi:hypothetical protein
MKTNNVEAIMSLLGRLKLLFSRGSIQPRFSRRLDGRSKALLTASIRCCRGVTMKEAKALFSPKDDEYAFGEMDEVGKGNLAAFAAGATPPCLFEFHAVPWHP